MLPSPLLGSSSTFQHHGPIGLHKRTSTKPNNGLRDVSKPHSDLFEPQLRERQPVNHLTSKPQNLGLEFVGPRYAKAHCNLSTFDSARLFHLLDSDGPQEQPGTKELQQNIQKSNNVPHRLEPDRLPQKSFTLVDLDSDTSPIETKRMNQSYQRLADSRTFLHKNQDGSVCGRVSRKVVKPSKSQFRQTRERLRFPVPIHPVEAPRTPEPRDIQSEKATNENNAAGFGIMISERVKKRRRQYDHVPLSKKRNTRQIPILSSSS